MARGRKPIITTHSIEVRSSKIELHVFEPPESRESNTSSVTGTIVTVHPWATLGGGEHNTIGLARCIATQSSWRVITFTLQSTPLWRGGAVWGILSKHNYEVQQIAHVTQWAIDTYGSNVVLLGSSAGAPMAGSAMAQVLESKNQVGQHGSDNDADAKQCNVPSRALAAYVAVGYTFGIFASLGFGRHFSSVTYAGNSPSICGADSTSPKEFPLVPPKLFIMGENDEFTTAGQLEQMVEKMKANCTTCRVDSTIVPNVGHFELESPSYDPVVSKIIIDWLDEVVVEKW